MSIFKNFIQDFPIRCGEILTEFTEQAVKKDREVTLMLAVAAAGLSIPFERLRDKKHSSGDREKLGNALGKFTNFCGKSFIGSDLYLETEKTDIWKYRLLNSADLQQEPESWMKQIESLSKEKTAIKILAPLRNALAHGNIYTEPEQPKEKNNKQNPVAIKTIIFLSQYRVNNRFNGRYELLAISPEGFKKFLLAWITFLKGLNLPKGFVQNSIRK